MPLQTPVLFCVFNRPALTQRVFAAIRRQRPRTLLVVQDGPRPDCPADQIQVAATRAILDQVDWDCDLRTHFSPVNLGCKRRMETGISWAFAQCERLIVLEDDCLPADSFFGFCQLMLERYANDPRIAMISGDNFQPFQRGDASYYFSKWTHIWGWASWRRAWKRNEPELASWPAVRSTPWLRSLCSDDGEYGHWRATFDRQHRGEIDTWDYPWMYACWRTGGLTVLPTRNLVTNLGFGHDATHTRDEASPLANLPRCEMGPLRHPARIARDAEADAYTWRHIFRMHPSASSSARSGRRRWWTRPWRKAS